MRPGSPWVTLGERAVLFGAIVFLSISAVRLGRAARDKFG